MKKFLLTLFLFVSSQANAYMDYLALYQKGDRYVFIIGDIHTSKDTPHTTKEQRNVENRDTARAMSFIEALKNQRLPTDFLLEGSERQRNDELKSTGEKAKQDGLLSTLMFFGDEHRKYGSISFIDSDRRPESVFMTQHVTSMLNGLVANMVEGPLAGKVRPDRSGNYGAKEFDADLKRNPSVKKSLYGKGGYLDQTEDLLVENSQPATVADMKKDLAGYINRIEANEKKLKGTPEALAVLLPLKAKLNESLKEFQSFAKTYQDKKLKEKTLLGRAIFNHVRKLESYDSFFDSKEYANLTDIAVFTGDLDLLLDTLESQQNKHKTVLECGAMHAHHIGRHLVALGYSPLFKDAPAKEDTSFESHFTGSRYGSAQLKSYFDRALQTLSALDNMGDDL